WTLCRLLFNLWEIVEGDSNYPHPKKKKGATMNIYCDRCGRQLERLETYISVYRFAVCEECYFEMPMREFIESIGGEIAVVN
ncbi:MAG: hypothetical protein IJ367_03035, partial [Clostridia bacterium]|nr:hypothetical protein [Clostridia bacterium]